MGKLKEQFTNDTPVTAGRFLTTYVPIIITLIVAAAAGITAWAQVVNDVEALEEQQTKIESTLEDIRDTQFELRDIQSEFNAVLRVMGAQNTAISNDQDRIYDSLQRLHDRFSDQRDNR